MYDEHIDECSNARILRVVCSCRVKRSNAPVIFNGFAKYLYPVIWCKWAAHRKKLKAKFDSFMCQITRDVYVDAAVLQSD